MRVVSGTPELGRDRECALRDENASKLSLDAVLDELTLKAQEHEEISNEHLAEERKQPKSVQGRRQANRLRALQASG